MLFCYHIDIRQNREINKVYKKCLTNEKYFCSHNYMDRTIENQHIENKKLNIIIGSVSGMTKIVYYIDIDSDIAVKR